MAPGNNERHPGHTGTIPKTKVRNNCNVPQEAVTPTRRDMTTNLVTVRNYLLRPITSFSTHILNICMPATFSCLHTILMSLLSLHTHDISLSS